MQANCPTISWRVLQVKQHDAAITWVVKLAQVTWQLGNLASREPLTMLGRFTAIPFQRTKKGQFFQTLQAALQMVYEGVQSFVHFAAFCLRAEHSHSFIQRYFRFLPLFCSTVMRLCLAFTDASNVSTFSRSYSLTSAATLSRMSSGEFERLRVLLWGLLGSDGTDILLSSGWPWPLYF